MTAKKQPSAKKIMQVIKEWEQVYRDKIEALDPMPKEDGSALWAWYKRQERAYLRRAGYIRMDIQIPPKLYKKLKPHLMPYCQTWRSPRGSELVQFLEDLEITE